MSGQPVGVIRRFHTDRLFDQDAQAALVIFGHDDAQWKTLKKLPEDYG